MGQTGLPHPKRVTSRIQFLLFVVTNDRLLVFLPQAVVYKRVLKDYRVPGTPSDHCGAYTLVSPFLVSSAVHLPLTAPTVS